MKQVISGKLKEQPVVQEKRNRKTGEKVPVLSFTLLAEDDAAPEVEVDGVLQKKRIPLSCMAYGDLAREIGELEKGARVTASTIMRYGENQQGSYPVYVIKRIDPDNDLQRQMNHLLTGYEEGQYDQVFEREFQPEFTLSGKSRDLLDRLRASPEREQQPAGREEREEPCNTKK